MRKLDKFIIWPAYFDSAKTRKEGRRVPKNLAIQSPKAMEIEMAAAKLGLKYEAVQEVSYPNKPWLKTGMVMVEKEGAKEKVIARIAKQILKTRSEIPK